MELKENSELKEMEYEELNDHWHEVWDYLKRVEIIRDAKKEGIM